ncbi:caspase domain-containing protein [Mycena latifolia]|nr:caspase domain-containing protein [Mycena latifolia]
MNRSDIHSSFVNLGLAQVTPLVARKKALLIGVEGGDATPLPGTHEDIKRFGNLLAAKFGFKEKDITIMLDDGVQQAPTKVNIMAQLKNFLGSQYAGDLFVFVYAGHAKQSICLDGSEEDGLDEGIITSDDRIPCDDPTDGYTTILDDVLHDHLVKPLAPGCRLVAFFDTCHSETLLDLEHHRCNRLSRFRRTVRRLRELTGFPAPAPVVDIITPGRRIPTRFCSGYCKRVMTGNRTPNVVCFSACKDSQMVFEGSGESMLNEVINQLELDPSPTLKTLMRALSKNAKRICRSAREEARRKKAQKAKRKAKKRELEVDGESDAETVYEVAGWAPQVSV